MKIAIYSRKSKFTGKGDSIGNQIELCKEHIYKNYNDENIEFLIYEDECFSGCNTNRPKFQELMYDIKNKYINILICYRLDRISRNVSDFSSTLDILQNYNVEFISIREQFDTSSPMGRAMIYISSIFAQLERETIAERVRDNMHELARNGRWLGGVPPLGYDSTPITFYDENMKERKLVNLKANKDELKLVKTLYEKYLELGTISKVETWCQQNNIRSRRGNLFTKSSLANILKNSVYVKADESVIEYLNNDNIEVSGEVDGLHGILTYSTTKLVKTEDNASYKRVKKDKEEWIASISSHKGIIDAKDWLKVQKLITNNKTKIGFVNKEKTHTAMLSGKIRCRKCNNPMIVVHGWVSKATGDKNYHYSCKLKISSKKSQCDADNVKAALLDSLIANKLIAIGKSSKEIIKDIQNKRKQRVSKINLKQQEDRLNKSIAEKEKIIDSLTVKLALDDSITDILINKIKETKIEADNLKVQLNELKLEKVKSEQDTLSLEFIKALLKDCENFNNLTLDRKRFLIDNLINTVYYNSDTNKVTVDFFIVNDEVLKKN